MYALSCLSRVYAPDCTRTHQTVITHTTAQKHGPPQAQSTDPTWQSTIRHTLCVNKAFMRVKVSPSAVGKKSSEYVRFCKTSVRACVHVRGNTLLGKEVCMRART